MITIEEKNYKNFGKCVYLSNGIVELYVTIEKGPRIIKYSFVNEQNIFCDTLNAKMKVYDDYWINPGGHRMWHSPESMPRTYIPDNKPVKWNEIKNGIKVTQDTEINTNIQKQLEITLDNKSSEVHIKHIFTNKNLWEIKFAIWGITVMPKNGIEIIPQCTDDTEFLNNRNISLWTYSHINDSRINWGDKYILANQNPNIENSFKLGINNVNGWAAYVNNNTMFLKSFNHFQNGEYPDNNCSYETYICSDMVEMESLSPLKYVKPNCSIEHVENWKLFKNIKTPSCEKDVDKILLNIKNNK